MNEELSRLLDDQGGVVTYAQALTLLSRRKLETAVRNGTLQKVWHGVYGRGVLADLRLRGLDLVAGSTVATCLGTAAKAYGFDTENTMESEARLVMIDGRLPSPVLQYEIIDRNFQTWRVDFAWPEHRVVVEYDGVAWHSGPEAFVYDRKRRAALQELGWVIIVLIADDVRRRPYETIRRIEAQLARPQAA